MYYQNYEDYMRSVLGYPSQNQNMFETNTYPSQSYESQAYSVQADRYSDEVMDLYPDIYKIINPMVCKICEANTKPITRELIEQMTEEIYLNIESVPEVTDTVVNVRINTPKEVEKSSDTSKNFETKNNRVNSPSNIQNRNEVKPQNIQNREDRQRRPNTTLRDLIRILILNQLLGLGRPPRPRPPHFPRPPFPGPGGRPPFPRDDRYYKDYLKFQ